jgi:hypothetical protein
VPKWFKYLLLAILTGLALWIALYPADWQNWLGFSKAAYFTNGQNYAFTSGPGPMFLTTAGMSTIIVGGWHHLNCHVYKCMRVARFPVAGGQYKVCRKHHPDEVVRNGLKLHHIHEAHRESLKR